MVLRVKSAATVQHLLLQLLLQSCLQLISCQQSTTTTAGVYSGQQPDSCGYGVIAPSLFPNGHLATLTSSSPLLAGLPQSGCGVCLQVTCTDPGVGVCASGSPPVMVQIVDTSSSWLQLSSADMTALSPQGNRLGHVGASLQPVDCAPTGSIVVRLQQLTPVVNGYAKLALLNVAGSNHITSVGFAPAGTQNIVQLKNSYGAVWEGSLPSAPPLDLLISDGGQSLVLSDIVTAATVPGDIPSTVQFSAAGGSGSAGAAAPAAAGTPHFSQLCADTNPIECSHTGAVNMLHHAEIMLANEVLGHQTEHDIGLHGMSKPSRRSMLPNAAFQALQDYVSQQSTTGSIVTSPVTSPAASPAVSPAASPVLSPAASPVVASSGAASPSPAASPGAASPSPAASPGAASPSPAASPGAASPSPAASPEASPSPVVSSGQLSSPVPAVPAPAPAPASAEPLPATFPNAILFNLAAAASQSSCSTILEVLSLSPDLTTWIGLIQSKGLQTTLNSTHQGITMFAPINDAFTEPLLMGISGLDGAQTIMDLTSNIPDIISDLLGYSVVPQQLQENQLLAGDMFNTTNVVKTGSGVNGVPAYIPIEIKTTSDMTQVEGVGSIATIVQPNIPACGSIIHLVSNVLLPFNVRTFNLPTQTPTIPVSESSPTSTSPTSTPATAMSG